MQPKDFTSQIDELTRNFKFEISSLSTLQLQQKPTPSSWSIHQVIEHIIILNESYFPIILKLEAGTYKKAWLGNFRFINDFFGNAILKSVQPNNNKKVKTFSLWEPSLLESDAVILDKFIDHQENLKGHMERGMPFIELNTVISSPANKNVVYTLQKAFEILIVHEKRHLEQIKNIKKDIQLQG